MLLNLAIWLTRNFHDLPGRWRVLRWIERQADRVAALPPATVRFAPGLRMRVDPRDENGRRVLLDGLDRRERLTRHFLRLLGPGDCVLDVGANAGYYTMVASHAVGPLGSVHAFEPSPHVLPWLEASVLLSRPASANIHLHDSAASDRSGTAAFYPAARECTGFSSLRPNAGAAPVEVRCVPIDSLLCDLPAVRLVKLDIEGAELLALRGMQRLIERDRPHIISEIDDGFLRQMGASAAEMIEFLTARGYEVASIGERGALTPLDATPRDRINILAAPAGERTHRHGAARAGAAATAARPASARPPAG